MKAKHHICPSEDDTVIVDVKDNSKSPSKSDIEAKARVLVYRTLRDEFIKGNFVPMDGIEAMIQRTIKDMGG